MTVQITPYNPLWPYMFEQEAAHLKNILDDNCLCAHHVGSTSVPGLMAKPIIDIMCVVQNTQGVVQVLEQSSYIYRGEMNIPRRLYFKKSLPTDIHLYVCEEGHGEIQLNLMFRDYLRAHPETAMAYAALKKNLIAEPEAHEKRGSPFVGYTLGKNTFIKSILNKAGFKGLTVHHVTHQEEWEAYHRIRQELNLSHHILPEHSFHFVLYAGTAIVSIAELQFLQGKKAAFQWVDTDTPFQGCGHNTYLCTFLTKWAKEQGYSIVVLGT